MADNPYPGAGSARDIDHGVRLSVGELARMVGMSPRNIRAYQARQLLAPPVRQGRGAYYHGDHVRRLEAIKALQREGFNLVAVQAILGARGTEPGGEAVADELRRLARERPDLVHALARYGIVVRAEGGNLRAIRPRVLRSALHLRRGGREVGPIIELLVGVLRQVQPFADDLVRSASTRLTALPTDPELAPAAAASGEEHDRRAAAQAAALAGLLTESFRAAVERSSERVVPELMAQHPTNPRQTYPPEAIFHAG